MKLVTLALRTWLRYVVPLTILSAIALCVYAAIALRIGGAQDLAQARAQLQTGWLLAGFAWLAQLLLVAGVAPAVRGVADASAPSQLRVLSRGITGLGRGIVPTLVAGLAIAIGGLALAIPGLVLFVMLAMTGASERLGETLPAPFDDSIAAARSRFPTIALVALAMLAIDFAIGGVCQIAIVHALKKPTTTAALVATSKFVRVIAFSLIVVSPLPACMLAAAYRQSPNPDNAART